MKNTTILFVIYNLLLILFTGCDRIPSPLLFEGSSNSYLKKITVSEGSLSPAFNKDITAYTLLKSASVTKINITPVKEDEGAAIWVNNELCASSSKSQDITVNPTDVITIKVRAQDGETLKYYYLTITNL